MSKRPLQNHCKPIPKQRKLWSRSQSAPRPHPGTGFSPFEDYFYGFVLPFWTALDFEGISKSVVFAQNQSTARFPTSVNSHWANRAGASHDAWNRKLALCGTRDAGSAMEPKTKEHFYCGQRKRCQKESPKRLKGSVAQEGANIESRKDLSSRKNQNLSVGVEHHTIRPNNHPGTIQGSQK